MLRVQYSAAEFLRPRFSGRLVDQDFLNKVAEPQANEFRGWVQSLPDALTVTLSQKCDDQGWAHGFDVRLDDAVRKQHGSPLPPNKAEVSTISFQQIPYGVGNALSSIRQKVMKGAKAAAEQIQAALNQAQ